MYFITKLPRMDGGTSYIGFHGGKTRLIGTRSTLFVLEETSLKILLIRPMEVGPRR